MMISPNITYYAVSCAFLFQIAFVSLYISARWRKGRLKLLQTYPHTTFPNLYSQPLAVELARISRRKYMDSIIAAIGFTVCLALTVMQVNVEYLSNYMIYTAGLQILPVLLCAFWCQKSTRNMKYRYPNKNRTAELATPKLLSYVAPAKVGLLMLLYISSLVFALYIYANDMWADDSSRALLLVSLSTVVMVFIAILVYKELWGARKNHFVDQEEREQKRFSNLNEIIKMNIIYCAFIVFIQLINTFAVDALIINLFASALFQGILLTTSKQYFPLNPSVYK